MIGLSLGDAFLFQALVSLGPRLGSLLLSLAPIFGSIIAWVFFGETLTPLQITGIVLALAGIGWVVMSHEEPADTPHGHTRRGVIFGVLAGLGQAVGLVLSKQGMTGDFSPFQANAIRMLAAAIFIWIWAVVQRQAGGTIDSRSQTTTKSCGCLRSALWSDLCWACLHPCWRCNMPKLGLPVP